MKKNFCILIILLLLSLTKDSTQAQVFPQWGELIKGNYVVGYRDTIIWNHDEKYSKYNKRPYGISIWYPAIDNSEELHMNFGSYFNLSKHISESELRDTIDYYINGVLLKDLMGLKTMRPTGYAKLPIQVQALEKLKESTVFAKRNLKEEKEKFPVIFYHHGAQSIPFDNNVFCEYMASQGFVVVSGWYNLPSVKYPEEFQNCFSRNCNENRNLLFVAKHILDMENVNPHQIVAVGHSAGAQRLMHYDNSEHAKIFRSIISLHTTLEAFDIDYCRESWEEFIPLYENRFKNSITPHYLFAPSIKNTNDSLGIPEYLPFRKNTTTPYTFITAKFPLKHNAFISWENWINILPKEYQGKFNYEFLKQEQRVYEKIVIMTHNIVLTSLENKIWVMPIQLKEDFHIEKFNQ